MPKHNGVYLCSDQDVPEPKRFPGDPTNHAHYKSLAAGRVLWDDSGDGGNIASAGDRADDFMEWYGGDASSPVNNAQEL